MMQRGTREFAVQRVARRAAQERVLRPAAARRADARARPTWGQQHERLAGVFHRGLRQGLLGQLQHQQQVIAAGSARQRHHLEHGGAAQRLQFRHGRR
jgi:hypothetical protein